MRDDDYNYEDDLPAEPVDENSLSFILSKALKSVEEVGGLDRAQLRDLVGPEAYQLLISRPRVASAIDAYLSATPQTKRAAGRMLSAHIARTTDHPEALDRIERELQDTFADSYGAPIVKRASSRNQELQKTTAQQRSGQRVADPDLMQLAKADDISQYRQARLNRRGQQRQHRHGIP